MVRRDGWRDRWWRERRGLREVVPVNPRTLLLGTPRIAEGAVPPELPDATLEDFEADDFTLEPFPADTAGPLATISLTDVFSATPVEFGEFAPGRYRVVYERGAIFYQATVFQLRINAYSTSANGFKIDAGGAIFNAPGFNAGPDDPFRYAADDPRTLSELLDDIAARESGKYTEFDHPGGVIAMYLSDDFVGNAPTGQPPTFSLQAAG
jgi:hypothetical protein